MTKSLWQTYEDRLTLLKQLVNHQSITNTEGELSFPDFLKQLLLQLSYFEKNKSHIILETTEDGKEAVIAFYKAPTSSSTIVLISHFDTVGVDDYGSLSEDAFDPDALKRHFTQNSSYLSADAKEDLQDDTYLFGRGVMDMKAGLMLHLSLLELASKEAWNINLILVSVPDEEVNSTGMRKAVETIATLKKDYQLDIKLHLNSEPTFQQASADEQHYIYTGSIGKVMPGVLCYGQETHVGNPLDGLSANFMMSYINKAIEYNHLFNETFENETTPLPVSLMMRDIKQTYDVQTPFRTMGLYNMFLFKQKPADLYRQFIDVVIRAIEHCENDWLSILESEDIEFETKINVLTFEQLKEYAIKQHGEQFINNEIQQVIKSTRQLFMQSINVTDRLMQICRNITPAVVTYFATPYYPAVNVSYNDQIEETIELVTEALYEQFQRKSIRVHYFNGISDSSYLNFAGDMSQMITYEKNAPNFNETYIIPFEAIKEISAPTLLCGPIGKDAHKVSERLHKQSAFEELPFVLEKLVKSYI
ncbi:M20/M25/M40 family metallo-hydrolase [Staphylococcus edaphicus]|uniref:Arginine utilization protein RocB n=1 Tax=Staphylococcus edaphicus TaxID=1955013 RepID=A0A2C6WFH5_9STAP|nr:M20/M25/M40 family metallo-hydrolase [Staphylococcus edaphicus]PHK49568.1 arginine utilization protein RocB [Staphylococcus edaphicus]UQW82000.1 M20/M25/M40 family metallo-hydrolase [Staphylococcus edaphicus]